MLHKRGMIAAAAIALATVPQARAQEVGITPDTATRQLALNGQDIVISRIQDGTHRLTGEFTKTSRPCPPFCIAPITAAPGVSTVGELEVMDFLETRVANGTGLLIDSRVPEWFAKGSIPGAVNVPFSTLDPTNPYRDDILAALGGRRAGSGWDFTQALDLMMFCNGPWCEQSPRAIRNLVQAGYPVDKLSYYRGGMQLWLLLGLNTWQTGAMTQ